MGEKILIAVSGEDTRKLLKILEKMSKETNLEFLERVSTPIKNVTGNLSPSIISSGNLG